MATEITAKKETNGHYLSPKLPLKGLSLEVVQASLNLLSEIQSLEKTVDSHLFSLHNNENLSTITTFFQAIWQSNQSTFEDKTAIAKAQRLFNVYVDQLLSWIEKTQPFNAALTKITELTKQQDASKQVIREYLLTRVQNLHTSIPYYVLGQLLSRRQIDPTVAAFQQSTGIKIPKGVELSFCF